MRDKPLKMALTENPFYFHERLYKQQAVFLCPGDISIPFEENLLNLINKDNKEETLIKYCFPWSRQARQEALEILYKMNISKAVLFPGLDGFSQSLKYRLPFFKKLNERLTLAGQ